MVWPTRGRAWLRRPRHGYLLYTSSLAGSEGAHVENTSIDNQFKMLVGGRLGYTRVRGPATTPSRVVCAS